MMSEYECVRKQQKKSINHVAPIRSGIFGQTDYSKARIRLRAFLPLHPTSPPLYDPFTLIPPYIARLGY